MDGGWAQKMLSVNYLWSIENADMFNGIYSNLIILPIIYLLNDFNSLDNKKMLKICLNYYKKFQFLILF